MTAINECFYRNCKDLNFGKVCQELGMPANTKVMVKISQEDGSSIAQVELDTGKKIASKSNSKSSQDAVLDFMNKAEKNSSFISNICPDNKKKEETYHISVQHKKENPIVLAAICIRQPSGNYVCG